MAIFTLTKCALTLENILGSQLHVGAGRGHQGVQVLSVLCSSDQGM